MLKSSNVKCGGYEWGGSRALVSLPTPSFTIIQKYLYYSGSWGWGDTSARGMDESKYKTHIG